MTSQGNTRRRPSVHITLQRAARLHRLVRFLGKRASNPIGDPLRAAQSACGRFTASWSCSRSAESRSATSRSSIICCRRPREALGRLPFPDPQLSFAEMAELAGVRCAGRAPPGGVARRRGQSARSRAKARDEESQRGARNRVTAERDARADAKKFQNEPHCKIGR